MKKLLEFQLYGEIVTKIYGSVWVIGHCRPIASFNPLDGNEMGFNWVNLWPLYSSENKSKRVENIYYLCLLQKNEAKKLFEWNGYKRLYQNLHWWNVLLTPRKKDENIKTIVISIGDTWSSNLLDVADYGPSNNKVYRHMLVVIDNFSKYAWTHPLKNNYAQTKMCAFS